MSNASNIQKAHPKHLAEVDGAPQTQAEVTAGYVNPSQERMAAWEAKQELTR